MLIREVLKEAPKFFVSSFAQTSTCDRVLEENTLFDYKIDVLKDVRLPELLTLFKKTYLPARNVFHSRAQFFNLEQDDSETLDEYWKRLVDIARKCDFNNITAEGIITYNFAATTKDKRARDKFIKGPLKIQLVVETLELDNYNRKYGDKKHKIKKAMKDSASSSTSSELIGHTNQTRKRKHNSTKKEKFQTEIAASAENQTGQWNIFAQHGEPNATTAKRWNTLPKFANPRPSAG